MGTDKRIKVFQRTLARYGLYSSTWLITRLPYKAMRFLTHIFIAIGFMFAVKQKRIAYESLTIAYGGSKDTQEMARIARGCFEHVGKGMMEMIYFMAHPHFIPEQVIFEGKEHLDAAFKRGKGVIGVSAHFGNFPLMLIRLAQEGYAVSGIMRSTRDEQLEKYFLEKRQSFGLRTIYSHPRKTCVDTSIKVLRDNEFLFIPLDQNFGSAGGVFVDFFGQKAATATGPVVFALRTQAALVPIFMVRQKDDTHRIIIEPELPFEYGTSDQETVITNTARITQVIERYIRRYPQEWGWMHRRWKSKPPKQAGIPGHAMNGAVV